MSESLSLAFDLRFEDLYRRDGLARLDGCFVEFLKGRNTDLHNRLMAGRAAPEGVADKDYSDLIVELAVELEDFIAALFGIAAKSMRCAAAMTRWRRSTRASGCSCSAARRKSTARTQPRHSTGRPSARTRNAARRRAHRAALRRAGRSLDEGRGRACRRARPCRALRRLGDAHPARRSAGTSRACCSSVPHQLDSAPSRCRSKPSRRRRHDAAAAGAHRCAARRLRADRPGHELAQALDQTNYCIWCHNQGKDSLLARA